MKELLRQQALFVESLSDAEYAQQPDEFTSSVGCHLRHTLNHVRALLRGADSGTVDYDARDRGLPVERDRDEARRQTLGWIRRLDDVCLEVDRSLYVRSLVNAHGAEVVTCSSLSRELAFVLNHTIHHHAMMAAAARSMGAQAPAEFGVAPATLADRASASCVPSAS
jgi:uncharacterized damage-inducible protein DinB